MNEIECMNPQISENHFEWNKYAVAYHIIFWEYSLIIKKKPRLQFMEIFILDNEAVPLISI